MFWLAHSGHFQKMKNADPVPNPLTEETSLGFIRKLNVCETDFKIVINFLLAPLTQNTYSPVLFVH